MRALAAAADGLGLHRCSNRKAEVDRRQVVVLNFLPDLGNYARYLRLTYFLGLLL